MTKEAPDGGSIARTTVGVGEVVTCISSEPGIWSVSAGRTNEYSGDYATGEISWVAPSTPGNAKIHLKIGDHTVEKTMTVIAPDDINMTDTGERDRLTKGVPGVCMYAKLTVGPTSVSFSNLEWLEVSGGPSSVSGHFAKLPSDKQHHYANPKWTRLSNENSAKDHAAWHIARGDEAGELTWKIPNKYRVAGSGEGTVFTTTTQRFVKDANGTMTVSKAGATSAPRSIK